MPSVSLQDWRTTRSNALDELENAHGSVGGRRGGRHATQQLNYAYAVLLSSQFQGFCRALHSECADWLMRAVPAGVLQVMFQSALVENRKLDRGNPNPGNIGSDFSRFRLRFWAEVLRLDQRNESRRLRLEALNTWRNAIAHHDLNPAVLGTTVLTVQQVRDWRRACDGLASAFDEVMRHHLHVVTGTSPW